ncbi:MAG: S41 family peptidase [Planctomycetota bacterium]
MILQSILIGLLAIAVVGSTLAVSDQRSAYRFFDPLIDAEQAIERHFVDPLDREELQTAAIEGLIEALDDPYTVYVPATDRSDFDKDLLGEYVGIGAQITIREGWLTIVSPLDDSPALRAGLRPDDRVVAIDGEQIFEITTTGAAELLTGESGTVVNLTIERGEQTIELPVTRAFVKTRALEGFHRNTGDGAWDHLVDPDRGIYYARLVGFTPGADRELRALIESAPDLEGLILDLRNNPGGGLREAIGVADLFLTEGGIVSTKGRSFPTERYDATAQAVLPEAPVVVLINGVSASASEIVAGALSDNSRAVVLGERSYGKGSVQALIDLPNAPGAQLKLTTQRYYLPSGRSLQRMPGAIEWGVDPSPGFYVPMTAEQNAEAIRARLRESVIRPEGEEPAEHEGINWRNPDQVLEVLADAQLTAAVKAISQRLGTGEWVPVSEDEVPTTSELAAEELAQIAERRAEIVEELRELARRARELEGFAEPEDADRTTAPDTPDDDAGSDSE